MSHKKKIEKPKAIFFDWDGTLVDSYGFLNDAHGHVLEKLGLPPFYEGEYREYFGMPREVLYPKIYKEKCEEAKALFESYVFENSHKIKSIIGAGELLKHLWDEDIFIGVVSNKKTVYINKEADHLGWDVFFKVIVGGGDAQNDKPSSAPLKYAIDKAGLTLSAGDIWFVGDTESDLACAHEFGCLSVFVEGHKDSVDLIAKYQPDITVADCSQMQKILVAL